MSIILRLSLLCVALATIANAKSVAAPGVQKLNNMTVVNDVREFIAKHPDMKITQLTRQEGISPTLTIHYSLGGRINGDRLVSVGFGGVDTEDVSVPLSYPENGNGSILTYVEIVTSQSNYNGNAYVVDGGIGQRFITIIVEAQKTEFFTYSVNYYGTD